MSQDPTEIPLAAVAPPPLPTAGQSQIAYANWQTNQVYGAARNGNLLIVPDNCNLGPNCVKCNAPGSGKQYSTSLTWYPRWVLFLLFAGALIAVIVMLAIQKKGKVHYHLCAQHKKARRWLMLWTTLTALACPVLLAIAIGLMAGAKNSNNDGALGAAFLIAFFAAMIAAVVMGNKARVFTPTLIKDNILRLKGAGAPFLDTLPSTLTA